MKYKATIKNGLDDISATFGTTFEAAQWIEQNNNNMEFTSYIQELGDNNELKDWFYYTQEK